MLLTPDMTDAFGDWIALDRIRRALFAARPELDDSLVPDEVRPLLLVLRPGGGALLVARSAEDASEQWIVGIPRQPAPVLHEVGSPDEVVRIVLDALELSSSPAPRSTATDDQG
ncbi:hypothetical protein CFK39_03625 [Brachybacterium avium]|uniref:Uncharacterized protein n=1 Tax=Brachybacterium avium TaxID=2017485 RepID=A0A220UAX1_9MICO|nr:hypothetical protein [Brachybacterium avium]ASK65066.1 hypothetical protein CFK39_03625 [Brachybacterium avium]